MKPTLEQRFCMRPKCENGFRALPTSKQEFCSLWCARGRPFCGIETVKYMHARGDAHRERKRKDAKRTHWKGRAGAGRKKNPAAAIGLPTRGLSCANEDVVEREEWEGT